MRKVKKFLVPTLLVVFLMLTVVGSAPASDEQIPLRQGGKSVTVSAADCIPTNNSWDYSNQGQFVKANTGPAAFTCPVNFPESGGHWVYTVYLYAYDFNNGGGQDICATAYRTGPWNGSEAQMGVVCSSGASTDHVRTFVLSGAGLVYRWVLPKNGMYIYLSVPGPVYLKAYGMKVMYFT